MEHLALRQALYKGLYLHRPIQSSQQPYWCHRFADERFSSLPKVMVMAREEAGMWAKEWPRAVVLQICCFQSHWVNEGQISRVSATLSCLS